MTACKLSLCYHIEGKIVPILLWKRRPLFRFKLRFPATQHRRIDPQIAGCFGHAAAVCRDQANGFSVDAIHVSENCYRQMQHLCDKLRAVCGPLLPSPYGPYGIPAICGVCRPS